MPCREGTIVSVIKDVRRFWEPNRDSQKRPFLGGTARPNLRLWAVVTLQLHRDDDGRYDRLSVLLAGDRFAKGRAID
jgi:hypothetical protein